MPVIDAHVHITGNFLSLNPCSSGGRYDMLLKFMDDVGVDKAVVLPVVWPITPNNNQECAQLAKSYPDRLVTLTDVPLHEPDATERVARARDEFGALGISYYPPDDEMAWMLEPASEPLWEAYKTNDLVCNLQFRPPNYPVLLELARRHPEIRFVSNHLGLPGSLDPDDTTYGGLLEAASLPNLFVKASAFYAAAATPWDFHCPQALGFFAKLLAGLGSERLLWGSDWPPVGGHITYKQSLEIVRTLATDLDDRGRAQVLGENAMRVYKIS